MQKRNAPDWLKLSYLIRNKYSITLVVFLTWMLFFDQYNLFTQYRLKRYMRQLHAEKAFYEKSHQEDLENYRNIFGSPQQLEKYARENYLMKKDHEVVFVIVEKP